MKNILREKLKTLSEFAVASLIPEQKKIREIIHGTHARKLDSLNSQKSDGKKTLQIGTNKLCYCVRLVVVGRS